MVAFIFPGQGAQFVGMGKDLYDGFPEARKIFQQADEFLGIDLSGRCFEGPEELLKQTAICQPAILTTSIAALEAFRASCKKLPSPKFAAGLSLGEYSALVASGSLTLQDGLRLVRKRAELMEEAASQNHGKMAAVLGLERKILKDICLKTDAEIANINCPGQIVITGKTEAVDRAKEMSMEKGAKRVIDLEVSGAFHSKLMRKAAMAFKPFLDNFSVEVTGVPVISNFTAMPQYRISEIRENLVKQIYSPVLWEDSVKLMAQEGVRTFYEIGPGSILKGLIRKINPDLEVINIGSLKDIESLIGA